MPVEYFVSQNSLSQAQILDHSHEPPAVIDIMKRIHGALNHHPTFYAVTVNLIKQNAMTDLVIMTARGLGVVELKPETGSISMRGTTWYAGSKPIPGNPNVGYRNPHEQVQLYAATIREKLLQPVNVRSQVRSAAECRSPWLPGNPFAWERCQFGTAVCFTNEEATFDRFPFWHYKKSKKNPHIKPWEHFAILKPDEIPGWVETLRFGVTKGSAANFELYQLTSDHIIRIMTELFGAREWMEMSTRMHTI